MIRLARLHVDCDTPPAGISELVAAGGLNLLQLDYVRPRLVPAANDAPPELPEVPRSFPAALHSLCKNLFLEPELRVIASAGWSNAYVSVEHAAAALVEGGCPTLPISAVRGSNLMGILDFLIADGVPLAHAETGAPFKTLRAPLLAADLHLGAGPLATALAEGGRVVIAGCYDGAAPILAAGMTDLDWSPRDLDCLAGGAAAARAALWSHPHDANWLVAAGGLPAANLHPRIEVETNGSFTLDLSQPTDPEDAARLLAWLREGGPSDRRRHHPDVIFDASGAVAAPCGSSQLRINQIKGVKTDDRWWVDVFYHAGYFVEVMIEFVPGTPMALRRRVADAFRAHFMDDEDGKTSTRILELVAENAEDASATWLHVVRRAESQLPCSELADHVVRFAVANRELARLTSGRPTVMVECGIWPTRVPRDAVDFAVDTRPAHEWN